MSGKLRLYVARKLVDAIRNNNKNLSTVAIKDLIETFNLKDDGGIEMHVPLMHLERHVGTTKVTELSKIQPDDIIEAVRWTEGRSNRAIALKINRNAFVKDVIEDDGLINGSGVMRDTHNSQTALKTEKKTIVVEYSSPNIAKPFHLGHLRSTIIGNFIANLNCYRGDHSYCKSMDDKIIDKTNGGSDEVNSVVDGYRGGSVNVVRLNYLGDWGTQFGLVQVGVDALNYTEEKIKADPLRTLYEAYVHANKLAETDATISEKARIEFAKLETGSPAVTGRWTNYLHYTIEELDGIYRRLGVKFDEYNYESMYGAQRVAPLLDDLRRKRLARTDVEGRLVTRVVDRDVTLAKSDGSTMYLTRDLAAAIDRYDRYRFDRMYYVVDNAQTDHFNALKSILHTMDVPWSHRLHHVKFGRIRGMSTRKGTGIFLSDILDEMRAVMAERQTLSPTTKVAATDSTTADVLGVTCMIVNDLKQRRQRDYTFSWDTVLQVQGDSGIKLQYTHCRLHSLMAKAAIVPANECVPELLREPEVTQLVLEMSRFEETLERAHEQLESCLVVAYLFKLCNQISRTFKVLRVKGEEPDVAAQRLKLFAKAKEVLNRGMQVLGIQPLNEM